MDRYITGDTIRRIREERKMTQEELAERIHVSGKAVSRWETGRGYPDISLLESLAGALGISVIELMKGDHIINTNSASNMAKGRFYVCPVCGNVIRSVGEVLVSCCGITLPPLEAELCDAEHTITAERIGNEYFVSVAHPMTKEHHISFLCAVSDMGTQFVKLYPEGEAEAYFRMERVRDIYACCNRHALFRLKV
ncbi:MAG: helix-turn-helix domain-containing protein [Eubacteriales bacterium]|nr:helix-turn-helix domain-containing protein [Eubacteriales bacterium]